MDQRGALEELIRRARRRHFLNDALVRLSHAACGLLAGVVILLLLGTGALEWQLDAALLLLTATTGLCLARTRRQRRSSYQVAQQIDRRMNLSDTLSTAVFFAGSDCPRTAVPEMRRKQYTEAEQLAQLLDAREAVPIARPRSLYLLAALGLVASSLFALRYGFTGSLELRSPLASIVLEGFRVQAERDPAVREKTQGNEPGDADSEKGLSLRSQERQPGQRQVSPGASPEASASDAGSRASTRGSGSEPGGTADDSQPGEASDSAEARNTADPQSRNNKPDSLAPQQRSMRGESGSRSGSQQRAEGSGRESNGIFSRLRDAVSNVIARLGGNSGASAQRTLAGSQRQAQPQNRQQTRADTRSQSGSAGSGNAKGDQRQDGARAALNGPGEAGGADGDEATQQGRNGIGRQDGDKRVREAEQAAAMGKLSEVIGKRSQNVTGEAVVEVAGGKQELKTGYSQRKAKHSDTGGEIHRDEIPLEYQQYVQEYFKQVHKAAAPTAGPSH